MESLQLAGWQGLTSDLSQLLVFKIIYVHIVVLLFVNSTFSLLIILIIYVDIIE